MAVLSQESLLPIGAAAIVIFASVQFARPVVAKFARPESIKQFKFHIQDLWPLALGGAAMVISAILQPPGPDASVWSYFIDLGSFAAGSSLIVTSSTKSYPRVIGYLILGIHGAQVLITNSNAPLRFMLETGVVA